MKNNTTLNKSGESFSVRFKKDMIRNKSLYLIVIPVIVFYLLFNYAPMYGAVIAFKDFKPQRGILGSDWVGLKHFIAFFKNPSFIPLLRNTIRISASSLIFGFPAPIILAILLNELKSAKYSKIVQNFTYMPHFISMVVICGMLRTFCAKNGIINYVLSFFGFEPTNLLVNSSYFTTIYVASEIWQQVGWGAIIYLAALMSIDSQLYEAAMIDGAGKWKQLLNVTLPGILPTIVTMLILRLGSIINVGYEKILLLYNDATMNVADVISTYTYRKGLIDMSWSFSSAVGLFNSVINVLFLITANAVSKKLTDTSIW